ncbi:MAG: cupin domain-containing protein [Ginsengibacter sp.]
MKKFSFSIPEAVLALQDGTDKPYVVMMENGSMRVEYFVPVVKDTQQPHLQDELYVIASGTTEFVRDKEVISCNTGDVIFVPAGMDHRFISFSQDFAAWVIFYGAEGGES